MYNNYKVIALIPARGGSKGVKRKNIKLLAGKPLIGFTIEQALASKYIDKVIVSTDDKEIAHISGQLGAKVPFIRPHELADDNAKGIDVALHGIDFIEKNIIKENFIFVYLQPTSPLRKTEDIDNAIEELESLPDAKAVYSVCEAEHSPILMNTLPDNRCMKNFLNEKFQNKNRQELPEYYRLNGALYVIYKNTLKKHKNFFFTDETYAYIMPIERSIDIDSHIDFKFAEFLLNKNQEKPK